MIWVVIFDIFSIKETNMSKGIYKPQYLEILARAEENHFWFKIRRDRICRAFQKFVPKGARILEVGGGTGYIAGRLKELGFDVEMSDLHADGFPYARKRGIEKLHQFDLFKPPFQEEFDVISLFDVLEHLSDPLQALECIKSMLKPKGMVILTVPAHQWLWSREDVIADHYSRYCKSDLTTLFSKIGFESVQMNYFFRALLPF